MALIPACFPMAWQVQSETLYLVWLGMKGDCYNHAGVVMVYHNNQNKLVEHTHPLSTEPHAVIPGFQFENWMAVLKNLPLLQLAGHRALKTKTSFPKPKLMRLGIHAHSDIPYTSLGK